MPKLKILPETPASLGYSFPAEWEPHAATWFSWPRPEGISFPDKYHTVPENLARIIREITPREQVHINVPNGNYERIVKEQLKANGCPLKNIFFHQIKTNESWCRDHGPAFVLKPGKKKGAKSQAAIVDWGFNAWGGKYPPFNDDDAVPTRIAEEYKLPIFYPLDPRTSQRGVTTSVVTSSDKPADSPPCVIMEGGAVDFNGAGTVLTTEQCLLNKNRNPHLSRKEIEQYLKDYYGQSQVLWLGEGIVGDDTDGHIDDLARFIDERTIVVAVEDDPKDENYKILQENLKRVKLLKDRNGKPFDIIKIAMPGVVEFDNQRLPATYVNFYFVNGALLVPTYRHRKNDRKALETLQRALPDRKVIGIDCTELIWGLGAIHCLTQQQPKF